MSLYVISDFLALLEVEDMVLCYTHLFLKRSYESLLLILVLAITVFDEPLAITQDPFLPNQQSF